jgi:CubicO group peptidase (beta-lactamase class C family)
MLKVSRRLLILVAPLWLAAVSTPLAAADDVAASAEALVEAAWPADGPGAAVIVTRGGEVVYAGARGLADVETRRPITVDTTFRLGSISKQFTAALVLKLVDEGKVSLDDPLSKFVPGFPAPGGQATIRQLLNHTSGIRSFTGLPGAQTEAATSRHYTTGDIVALIRDEAPDFAPGSDWRYNNSGYVLLVAVIEAVTGQPWQVALEERITRPLGLTTIRYAPDESAVANRALPYTMGQGGVRPAQKVDLSSASGAGGLVGSVRDLARWGQALHHGQVVSAASYAQMVAPTVLPDGRTIPYGFGLEMEQLRGFAVIGHSGGIQGGVTDSLYLPEQDLFVAVFVNSDMPQVGPGVAARRLAALEVGKSFPEYRPVTIDPAALEPWLGLYKVAGDDGREGRFYARDGRLFTQMGDEPERPVLASAGGRFFYGPDSLAWFEARRDPAGGVVLEAHVDPSDRGMTLTRTGPIPPPPVVTRAMLERYVGRYELNGTIATIGLTTDNRLTVQLTGQPVGAPLRTVSADEFAGDQAGVRVRFEGEGPKATVIRSRYAGSEVTGTRIADEG